jgi:EAL and modified HD-GYP domain-containing signal transduction protein
MLNVLTGVPIGKLVEELPLAKPVETALVQGSGDLGTALQCVRAYERGRWQEVSFHNVPHPVIRAAYVDAVFWAEQARAMFKR